MIWVLLQSESPWQRNNAITFFIYLCVSLYQEFFLKKSLKGVCTCHNVYVHMKLENNASEKRGRSLVNTQCGGKIG